jgi:DNA-binding IclR family transcriptional regulator
MAMSNTIFVDYFGDNPIVKVLDFLIENDLFDYSKTDIHQHTGLARTTLNDVLPGLVEKGLLVRTRSVGRAEMYKLNRGHPVVEMLVELATNLALEVAKQELNMVEA